ncbi:hypothetical protein EPUS_02900 [Endocarpon pusillum Z07020]|uniref:Transcriptional regulator Ngg1 n=1 Tax=Endocarpon pusillum (strain Z07020 / HMAS-L-300199) TaxID=1263415 RepID=U1HSF5_ENDPU|nr:uncharacterized protein EPUS_02900 [Endocarpon pusillum Z07020]ERF72109.1 hypothetical protein EPUS_02900 [Endocarpon pusillum Z07020]
MSPGSSSLSEMAQSPDVTIAVNDKSTPKKVEPSAETSEDERQPPPAPPVTQHAFFPDPLAPDPVIYHIREVTPGMTDEEKKEIYSVTAFPTQDLSDQIAGTPPDKDFSNAKPTNQVAPNTFLSYVETYVRPLTEEDIAFLRERGDRTTPFVIPSRGERHYSEIWAAEDTNTALVSSNDMNSVNKPNGSIEDINDDTVGTDKISGGPLANRLLSLLRFEHRSSPTENGITTNGAGPSDTNLFGNDTSMDLDPLTNGHLDLPDPKPLPSASSVAEQHAPKSSNNTSNGASTSTNGTGTGHPPPDDRIKLELRHLGFLGVDEEPDFAGHHDDDISVRLRLLQSELKKVMITNGARKARLLDIARERLAYQEYSTIHEDLDSQVQQAYLKRTRTLGKSKKGHHGQGGTGGGVGRPRPGNAVNGSVAGGQVGAGLARQRDIGDSARMLMDRRKRWEDCIGPVFEGMRQGVPKSVEAGGETLWDERVMERYEKAEREGLEDETDG